MSETGESQKGGPRRRALVTGASGGIGASFAERLAQDGYDLVLVARNRQALEALAKQLRESRGAQVEVLSADLTQPQDLQVVEVRAAEEPGLDLLVNNAGFGSAGHFATSDADIEEEQIRLNVTALVRLTRAALPRMIERGRGGIINVSSLAALGPSPFTAVYGASKAFVNSFTEALREELRDTGVRVQALCPGFTRTGFQERAGIEPSTVPGFAWMEPEPVVAASLAGLEKGELICVPGLGNQALALLEGLLPRAAVRRAVGAAQGRRYRQ